MIFRMCLLASILTMSLDIKANTCHDETGWCYVQSTSQAFYMFDVVTIGGEEVIAGEWSGNPPGDCPFDDCDVVAAFNGETCVAWSYYYKVNDVFTLVLMGADGLTGGAENYLLNGDYPTFKIYQAETGYYYNAVIESGVPMFTNFGNSSIEEMSAEEDEDGNVLSNDSINEIDEFSLYEPYPNPFNSTFKLDYHISNNMAIEVLMNDIHGHQILNTELITLNKGRNTIHVELDDQPSGVYIISVKSKQSIMSRKVIYLK